MLDLNPEDLFFFSFQFPEKCLKGPHASDRKIGGQDTSLHLNSKQYHPTADVVVVQLSFFRHNPGFLSTVSTGNEIYCFGKGKRGRDMF